MEEEGEGREMPTNCLLPLPCFRLRVPPFTVEILVPCQRPVPKSSSLTVCSVQTVAASTPIGRSFWRYVLDESTKSRRLHESHKKEETARY